MEEKQAWAEEQESGFAEAELIYGDMPDATEGPLQSADDALVACLNHFARVDLNWMSIQAGIPVGELIRELDRNGYGIYVLSNGKCTAELTQEVTEGVLVG